MHPLWQAILGLVGIVVSVAVWIIYGLWPAIGIGIVFVGAEVVMTNPHPLSAGTALVMGVAGGMVFGITVGWI